MSNPSPSAPGAASAHAEQPWLIVFADLTRFMVNSRSTPALTLAGLLDGYYRHAEGLVAAARGRVVKFMGDAFLAVWPEAQAGEEHIDELEPVGKIEADAIAGRHATGRERV